MNLSKSARKWVGDMRDFDQNPYSSDELRVVEYLSKMLPGIGAGDDPISFLMASHGELAVMLKEAKEELAIVLGAA